MPIVIAVLIGLLAGAGFGGGFGVVVGPIVGWLAVRSVQQQREIAALRRAAELTASDLAATAPIRPPVAATVAPTASPPTPTPPSPPSPSSPSSPPTSAAATVAAAIPATASAAAAPPVPLPPRPLPPVAARSPVPPPAPPRPNPLEPIRAWFFGGNTIVKAGVAILFVGLAFLAKYAAEHTQVPIEWRLAGIAFVAFALLAVGWRLRLRRAGYAQVLQGGAVAVLYLTIFAAFRFYGVLAVGPAFALMAAIAALSAALAVLQDARSLAVVGALGGFAAPLLLSTGGGNHVALFAYYLVLDLGIAAIAWSKSWRSLNLIGFFCTFVVATAWGVLRYTPADYASGQAFLIAFFLVFVAVLVLPARRAAAASGDTADRAPWVNTTLLFGLPTVVFALQYGLVRDTEYGAALSALALGAFYVALAAWMRGRPGLGIPFDAALAVATVLLTLVIPFALDERSTAGAWTLEAAGLVWAGLRQRRLLPRAFGYALFVVSAFAMLFAFDRHGVPDAVWNAYLWNGVMAAAAAIAAAFFVHRAFGGLEPSQRPGSGRDGEAIAEPLLIGLATLWIASTALLQIDRFVLPAWQAAAALAVLAATGIVYALLSARLAWTGIGWPLLAAMPVALLIALGQAADLADPLRHGGWWAWPLVFAAHALALARVAPRLPRPAAHAMHALGALVLALVGALAGRAVTAGWGDAESAWPWLGWLVVPALLLLALPRPRLARAWPVRDLPEAYAVTASGALAVLLWLWTLVANAGSNGSAAPLPHLPFLNPLDLGVALALVAIAWAARGAIGERLRADSAGAGTAFVAALAVAGFAWLNAILLRGFFHYDGVPYRVDAWTDSFAVQTGLALLWTATALGTMWLGARLGRRGPWLAGAGLLAVVVLKLVAVDLMAAGTVTRIVSFIGVGIGMLVIGYVAPLPAAAEKRHAST